MKIHILYPFTAGPWGGANQFLKAIRDYFIKIGVYVEDENEADIILFNASPMALYSFLDRVYLLKKNNPNLLVINRIDGPVYYIRDKDIEVDKAFYYFNEIVCDGTIFQSSWSKKFNIKLGMKTNQFETTILNAPNKELFNYDSSKKEIFVNSSRKINLIASSWSSNWKKGFDIYQWLDHNLDFNKYQFTFIGNTPIPFKNIIHKPPMNSKELASELKCSDIFITASQKDPCSNSLIEALHCGVVSIGLNDGGHPEIIAKGGEIFNNKEDLPALFNKITLDYEKYQKNITLFDINVTGELYLKFLESIFLEKEKYRYRPKIFHKMAFFKLKWMLFLWKVKESIFVRLKK